ncbi:hypothetical protein Tco_1176598 [Tanacetum coccineum]
MSESSSQNPSSPEITPKEELVTLDRPESLNPFLPASQVDFTFIEITFTTNNEVALLYPSHPNQECFKDVSYFISKCCLNESFTRAPTQYKEYLSEFWYTTKTLEGFKVWVSTLICGVRGDIGGKTGGLDQISNKDATILYCLANGVQVDYAKIIWEDLVHKLNKKSREKIVPYPSSAKDKSPSHPSPLTLVVGEMHKEAQQTAGDLASLGATSEEGAHPQLNSSMSAFIIIEPVYSTSFICTLRSYPNVLVDKTKSAGDGFKTAHTDLDEPIIISDESEEEEEVANDKYTDATFHDVPEDTSKEELEQAKAKAEAGVASLKAKPSYPNINQLTELLVTSLKHELSKLLASHDFASCLPTELKELPSKITGLSREIKELKKHVRDMEIELPGDLKEIPTKLETFTSIISSLSSQVAELKNIEWELPAEFLNLPSQVTLVQEKLKTFDSLPSLLHKVTDTLNRFSTMVENASGATSMNVPLVGKATASLAEGEKNTKDADANLKDELVDLLGKNIVTQYYTKKLLFDKYCDKMLKRTKSPKITNCEVLIKKGPITLKIYRQDESDEVISNLKVNDLH